jgi:hypothetical protein
MPSELPNPLDVAVLVAGALDRAGVEYFLGGSVASSLQGEPRSTNDIDFVVDLRSESVAALIRELGEEFEVDEEALRDAVRARASWNIFHLSSMMKIDLFIRRPGAFDDSEFARRRTLELEPGVALAVKSPEDSVLRKLVWFRDGGGVSSTQWRDVVEVLRVSSQGLDERYLVEWAEKLGVGPLLENARAEARL